MQMNSTAIKLSPKQRALFATGYGEEDTTKEAVDWDMASLAAAGALGSNVPDLARFLSLQMRAGQADVKPVSGGTLTELHTPQRLTDDKWDMAVGLGWHIKHGEKSGDLVWHNGGMAGYHSFIGFFPKQKVGVIVLTNCGKSVDEIGGWLAKTASEAAQGTVLPQTEMPSAAEILDKYVEATGGAKAYESLRSAVTHSKGSAMSMPVTLEEYMASPTRCYSRLNMGPLGTVEQGTDGRTAWTIQGGQAQVLEGNDREEMLREANLLKDVQWRDLYKSAKCTGVVDFEGHKCYKVVMTPNKGAKRTRYYDVRTGLLVGQETVEEISGAENVSAVQIYDDYRKFGPLMYPAKAIVRAGGVDVLLNVENVEWNVEIPADRFDLPAAVKAQLKQSATSQPAAPATQPGR